MLQHSGETLPNELPVAELALVAAQVDREGDEAAADQLIWARVRLNLLITEKDIKYLM